MLYLVCNFLSGMLDGFGEGDIDLLILGVNRGSQSCAISQTERSRDIYSRVMFHLIVLNLTKFYVLYLSVYSF